MGPSQGRWQDRRKHQATGSTPLERKVAAADGALRNAISARAVSGCLAAALKPAANSIRVCKDCGSGPATSMPATPTMRVATTTTMSASPRATTSTQSSAGIGLSLPCISRASPRRSTRPAKYNPLAPCAGIRNRLGGGERAFEVVDRADGGPGRAGAYADGKTGGAEAGEAAGDHMTGRDQLLDGRGIADRDVEGFARLPAPDNLRVDVELQIDRVPGRVRELLAQFAHGGARAIAAQHFQIGHQCADTGLMLAALMTLPHFAISVAMNLP